MNAENLFRAAGCALLASLVTFAVVTGAPQPATDFEPSQPSALEVSTEDLGA